PDFFVTLGPGPVIGRTFTDEETTSQTDHVAILSDTFWRQRFDADPHVIGRQIRVNSVPRTVIGVLPPAFRFLSSDARVFLPLASGRVKELAVRQALGANRGYVVSEVVVETTLLTLAGGLLGLAVGVGGTHLLRALGADHLPLGSRIAFDMRLALVSLVTAI